MHTSGDRATLGGPGQQHRAGKQAGTGLAARPAQPRAELEALPAEAWGVIRTTTRSRRYSAARGSRTPLRSASEGADVSANGSVDAAASHFCAHPIAIDVVWCRCAAPRLCVPGGPWALAVDAPLGRGPWSPNAERVHGTDAASPRHGALCRRRYKANPIGARRTGDLALGPGRPGWCRRHARMGQGTPPARWNSATPRATRGPRLLPGELSEPPREPSLGARPTIAAA